MSAKTIRAVRISDSGTLDAPVHLEVERSVLLPTEVLVRVKAAGVNPVNVLPVAPLLGESDA